MVKKVLPFSFQKMFSDKKKVDISLEPFVCNNKVIMKPSLSSLAERYSYKHQHFIHRNGTNRLVLHAGLFSTHH